MAQTVNMRTFKTVEYTPVCKYGCENCIYDPEYIKNTHPDWYAQLVSEGRLTSCDNCVSCSHYDDEDK